MMRDTIYTAQMGGRFGSKGSQVDMECCRAGVWGEYTWHQCYFKPKYEEGGIKFCGVHLPSKIKAKADKRNAKFRLSMDRSYARQAVRDALSHIANVAVEVFDQKATYDDLEKAVIDYRSANDHHVKMQEAKDD